MTYNQKDMDQKFEALLQQCRDAGLVELANHYKNLTGMQRINAVRFMEAVFAEKKKQINLMRVIGMAFAIVSILGVVALLIWNTL